MKKLSEKNSVSWTKVIIFSIITGVYTAAVNLIPFFEGTSFRDTAVNPEAWILFAMIIIMNCKTRKEAAIKTFVFFLISQPLIYLIEALFGPVGFEVFSYYKRWFIITLFTLPGAAVAFQVKKKNLPGALVLSVATGFLGYMAVTYYYSLKVYFPNHLLSLIFCVALAVGMIILFVKKPKLRIIPAAAFVAAVIVTLIAIKPVLTQKITLPEGDWDYTAEDSSVVQIEEDESGDFTVKAGEAGSTLVTFKNENGEIREYYITVAGNGIYMNEF